MSEGEHVSGQTGEHPRGVYLAEFPGPAHTERLVLVDSHGVQIGAVTVRRDEAVAEVARRLRRLLDLLDPPARRLQVLE